MKNSALKILALLLIFAGFGFAGERVIWHRSYFVGLGLDASFSFAGDLDGKGFFEADDDDGKDGERIFIPYLGSFPIPVVEAGVNFNQHTVAIAFGLWNPDVNYGKNSDDFTETDANYWKFSAEYRYYFFYPEDFEVGPGLSYTFSRYSVHGAGFYTDKYGDEKHEAAVYAANSFALSANLRYKMRPIGIDVAFRYRAMFVRSVSTDYAGYSDLSRTLWQHQAEVHAKVFYEF